MKKHFSVYPHSTIELTSNKNVKTLVDQIYQQIILKDSETKVDFFSDNEKEGDCTFDLIKEFKILPAEVIYGSIKGNGCFRAGSNGTKIQILLRSGSLGGTIFFYFTLFIFLAYLVQSFFTEDTGSIEFIRSSLFGIFFLAVLYGILYLKLKSELSMVEKELLEALK